MHFTQTDRYFWQGDKIRLRSGQLSDWETIYQESTDSEDIRLVQSGIELPLSPEMAKAEAEKYANFVDTSHRISFAIETLSGELAGGINIHSKDQKHGTFGFGIRINRSYQQQGFAEEALRIILRYAFYELRYQKCNSFCVHVNECSIRLHRKVGFIEEGRRRRSVYTNGQYYDNLLFGLTREEFDENEQSRLSAPR
jgi:RimJ/RimL family protein N-acetyltransferase